MSKTLGMEMKKLSVRILAFGAVLGLMLGFATSQAISASPVKPYWACLKSGLLSKVGTTKPTCAKPGAAIQLSTPGPQGVRGLTGPKGAAGPKGDTGEAGASVEVLRFGGSLFDFRVVDLEHQIVVVNSGQLLTISSGEMGNFLSSPWGGISTVVYYYNDECKGNPLVDTSQDVSVTDNVFGDKKIKFGDPWHGPNPVYSFLGHGLYSLQNLDSKDSVEVFSYRNAAPMDADEPLDTSCKKTSGLILNRLTTSKLYPFPNIDLGPGGLVVR